MIGATRFEFKHRFWIISAIFVAGFTLFAFDISAIATLRHWLAPGLRPNGAGSAGFARIVIGFGAFLVLVAALIRTWASAYLRTDIVHDSRQHSEALVADGPFRFTRNPLYLANVPMAAGIGLLSSRLGWMWLVAANWLFVYRLIFREEAALRENQGESYLAYCRSVPRFWPALRPRVPASGRHAEWGQAFSGELFVWLFGIAEIVIAATLNVVAGLVVFAAGFAAHFVTFLILRQRKRRA